MTQQQSPGLGDEISAGIGAERYEELMLEAAKEDFEKFGKQIDELWESGWFVFAPQPPRVRLANYRNETLPEDAPLLMDEDYRKALIDRQAPPLAAQAVIDAWQMAQDEAKVTGQPVPQDIPQYALWPMLLNAWPPLFDKVARDFTNLIHEEQREWERQAAAMMGGIM